MPKRYQGNSGRYDWVEPPQGSSPAPPPQESRPSPPPHAPPPQENPPHAPPPPPTAAGALPGASGLHLLPKLLGELETEDLILLLLCWLLYRESGDSDWLIVLGALILA